MGIAILPARDLRRDIGCGAYTAVDARTRGEFDHGHIPGAVWMCWEEWCEPAPPHENPLLAQPGYWGVLADLSPDELARRLGARGLSSDRPLVVYADGPRSMGREGRIAWMLLYLGASTVYLLDGGWRGWLAADATVETQAPRPPQGTFTLAIQEHRRALFADLKRAYQCGAAPLFVDTRCREEFDGYVHPYMPRMGRLPAATLIPYAGLFDHAECYVARDVYMERLPAEVRSGTRELVTYCEVGVRASLVALLHEVHTGRAVAVFDGSLMQWALDPELPVHNHSTPV